MDQIKRSTDGGDPREVAGPLAEQAGSLTPPERDNGRGPSSTPPSTLSDAECDALIARHLESIHVFDAEWAGTRAMCRALIRAGRAKEDARGRKVGELVDRQAEDEGLWFIAQTAPEDYLQRALRELHAAIDAARGKP